MNKKRILISSIIGVVVSVFTIALMIPTTIVCRPPSQTMMAELDIQKLGQILELYNSDHGSYPDQFSDLLKGYLSRPVKDPWGNDYSYFQDASKVIIFTINGEDNKTIISSVHHKNI